MSEETLKTMQELAKCPICLGQISEDVKCCRNGHAGCFTCLKAMTACPMCREPLLDAKHTLLNQLLGVLPRPELLSGCCVMQPSPDHHLWCNKRLTTCRMCQWSGPVTSLANHVQSAGHKFYDGKIERTCKNFNMNTDFERIGGCVYKGEFFWRSLRMDSFKKMLTFTFTCVPKFESKDVPFHVTIAFKSGTHQFVHAGMLTNTYQGTKELVVALPITKFAYYIDYKNTLKYSIVVN